MTLGQRTEREVFHLDGGSEGRRSMGEVLADKEH
jgi:hypothetical protein